MKTARWWSAAILLLGLAVLGADGRPNKEGFGLPPYRPVVRFRHKVLIVFFFNLLSVTRDLSAFAKYKTNYSGTFLLHQMTLPRWLFFCLLKNTWWIIIPPSVPGDCLFKDNIRLLRRHSWAKMKTSFEWSVDARVAIFSPTFKLKDVTKFLFMQGRPHNENLLWIPRCISVNRSTPLVILCGTKMPK